MFFLKKIINKKLDEKEHYIEYIFDKADALNKTKYKKQLSNLKNNRTRIINDFLKISQLNVASMYIFIFIMALLYWGILYIEMAKAKKINIFTISIDFSILNDYATMISTIAFVLINLISIYIAYMRVHKMNDYFMDKLMDRLTERNMEAEYDFTLYTSDKVALSFVLTTALFFITLTTIFITAAINNLLSVSSSIGIFVILIIASVIIISVISIIASLKLNNFKFK